MIRLHHWTAGDLTLLEKTVGNPVMMETLGGPENAQQIARRHERYLQKAEEGGMFTISFGDESTLVGTVGFWETVWKDEAIYETGWMVLPGFSGRGIATQAALAIIERARAQHRHRFLHAFPSVSNGASNTVCRNAGFTNLGECTFEYPKGRLMQSNDWRIDLFP